MIISLLLLRELQFWRRCLSEMLMCWPDRPFKHRPACRSCMWGHTTAYIF